MIHMIVKYGFYPGFFFFDMTVSIKANFFIFFLWLFSSFEIMNIVVISERKVRKK